MAINEGYLLAQDSYRGAAGKAFVVINGSNELLFGLTKFESSAEIQTGEFKVVGALTEQEKVKGLKYSGSATIYYGTPTLLKLCYRNLSVPESSRYDQLPDHER
ncbi:MAG: phage tail tube protein [Lachnospiraceae bacterium]